MFDYSFFRGRDKTRKRNTECGTEWRKRIPEADSANEDKTRIPEADSANKDKTRIPEADSANEDKTRIPQMRIKRGFRK